MAGAAVRRRRRDVLRRLLLLLLLHLRRLVVGVVVVVFVLGVVVVDFVVEEGGGRGGVFRERAPVGGQLRRPPQVGVGRHRRRRPVPPEYVVDVADVLFLHSNLG